MITLHHLNQSRSMRIVWLLEELGAPYTLKLWQRNPKTKRADLALRDVHPLGRAPILEDDTGNQGPFVLSESGAIVEYLVENYAAADSSFRVSPKSANYWDYRRYLHYAEASLMPLLFVSLIFRRVEQAPVNFCAAPIVKRICRTVRNDFTRPELALHLSHVNEALHGKTWLMGDTLTGADIMISFPLQAAIAQFEMAELDVSSYGEILRYLEQIEQRPAWQLASQKVGVQNLKAL